MPLIISLPLTKSRINMRWLKKEQLELSMLSILFTIFSHFLAKFNKLVFLLDFDE